MARLWANGATCFCKGEQARRRQRCGWQWRTATVGGENTKWDGECVGQALGWLQDAAAMPGRPRRVAYATEGQRRVADTRRLFTEPVGHGDSEGFLKNAIQCSSTMTDSTYSTIINS